MEKVVNKLSEIEETAVAIIESANARKKEISDKMDIQIIEFDKKVDEDTKKALLELTKKLQTETEQELDALKRSTQKTLDDLEEEYEKNHSILANNIFNKIVRE